MIPCILFEDDHLLVANKPAGINTHAPDPFAGEGLYDWLRHREPRWAGLAIIHRLDKETSGVMVFGKTTVANRSLTTQFTGRTVRKKYVLLTDRTPNGRELMVKSRISRAGERYISSAKGDPAETRFRLLTFNVQRSTFNLLEAEPLTGRTHQIRVHAAENGFPVLGDILYGGARFQRVCLHAAELELRHPAEGQPMTFRAPVDFAADTRQALRAALMDPQETNACRVIHGAGDGWPGWYVDRFGDFLLSQGEPALDEKQRLWLETIGTLGARPAPDAAGATAETVLGAPIRGVYHKTLTRQAGQTALAEVSPRLVLGQAAPERFVVRENNLQFELSFKEGYSVGLFLDQRDNRRRLLSGHIAADFPLFNSKLETQNSKSEVLNTFAYTCGFSVCAAGAGAKTTSLDLSKKYLDWGRRNFQLNHLDPAEHDFIDGDVFDWIRRLTKKGRLFDVILLDPPTFSRSKKAGVFRAEKDYSGLVGAALPLLKRDGVLFASTNSAGWLPAAFRSAVETGVRAAGRKIVRRHFVPQPPDFPVSRSEPAYLKTWWMRIG